MYGNVTPEMSTGRILAKGLIPSLPFSLGGIPFSIFLLPKQGLSYKGVEVLDCVLYQEIDYSPCPFRTSSWTEPAIKELGLHDGLLDIYDIYWGTGTRVETRQNTL